jgi:hypothetical protein
MNNIIICNFPNCKITTVHWHCQVQGCDHIFIKRLVHSDQCDGYIDDYHPRECCNGSMEILYHAHCNIDGCKLTSIHKHCDLRKGCHITQPHAHCSDENCNWTYNLDQYYNPYFVHCHFPGCTTINAHIHCQTADCTNIIPHSHCNVCNQCVNAYEFHEHCTYKPDSQGECNITRKHYHCEHCNMTILEGTNHTFCDCGECITNNDHYHCYTCSVRLDVNADHSHCMYCDKLTRHMHCRYVATQGCFIEQKHQHCSKCKRVKEKGKKHICDSSKNMKII